MKGKKKIEIGNIVSHKGELFEVINHDENDFYHLVGGNSGMVRGDKELNTEGITIPKLERDYIKKSIVEEDYISREQFEIKFKELSEKLYKESIPTSEIEKALKKVNITIKPLEALIISRKKITKGATTHNDKTP